MCVQAATDLETLGSIIYALLPTPPKLDIHSVGKAHPDMAWETSYDPITQHKVCQEDKLY
jgi:hypothetical protein